MAVTEKKITDDIYETVKLSIYYSKVKAGMPSNVAEKVMKKYKAPTLIMAGEKNGLFPVKGSYLNINTKSKQEQIFPFFKIPPQIH